MNKKSSKKRDTTMIVRVVIFGILLVVSGLLFVDRRARSDAQAAAQKLDLALESESGTPTLDEVHAMIGREPTETIKQGDDTRETFLWSSLIRSYKVYVQYNGAQPRLLRYSINKPLD